MYDHHPISRSGRPIASSNPLADYLATAQHGVDDNYAVLPRSLAESMPLPWQQQLGRLLAEFHQAYGHLSWPIYRVVPSRYEVLTDLDEEQLLDVGYLVEIDSSGDVVYRERSGARVDNPDERRVLVSCLDPIPGRDTGHVQPAADPRPVVTTDAEATVEPMSVEYSDMATPPQGLPMQRMAPTRQKTTFGPPPSHDQPPVSNGR